MGNIRASVVDYVPYLYKTKVMEIPALVTKKPTQGVLTVVMIVASLEEREKAFMMNSFLGRNESNTAAVIFEVSSAPEQTSGLEPVEPNLKIARELQAFAHKVEEFTPSLSSPRAIVSRNFIRTAILNFVAGMIEFDLWSVPNQLAPDDPTSNRAVLRLNSVELDLSVPHPKYPASATTRKGTVWVTNEYVTLYRPSSLNLPRRPD